MPQPDYIAAFPAYNDHYISKLKIPKAWFLKEHFESDNFIHFSETTFRLLAQKGLSAHIQPFPPEQTKRRGKKPDYFCFPWFIAEFKAAKKAKEFCYCQAANAGSAAILMFEKLCKWDIRNHNFSQIPPVLTMTTIGSEVKLWVVYVIKGGIKMSLLWDGDVKAVNDALRLTVIFENIHTWFIHELKPTISSNIKRWLIVHERELKERNVKKPKYRSGRTVLFDKKTDYKTKGLKKNKPSNIKAAAAARDEEEKDEREAGGDETDNEAEESTEEETEGEEDEVATPINSKKSISRSVSPSYSGTTLAGSTEKRRNGYNKNNSASTPELVKPLRVPGSYSARRPKPHRSRSQNPYGSKDMRGFDNLDDEEENGINSSKSTAFEMGDLRATLADLTSSMAKIQAQIQALGVPRIDEESSNCEDEFFTPESPSAKQHRRRKNRV
ncbi:hypothetical protein VHEMI03116 [[Torrubiella] hemipterigena]|nr:hypothetical protein VHEMI03116 [[Torrubiella] hemipterigena]